MSVHERDNIKVSSKVKEILDYINERDKHTSYDSVIRTLILRAGENNVALDDGLHIHR